MSKLVGWTLDDEDEIFVPCPDYPEHFDIGSKGTLRSRRTGKILSQTLNHNGYLTHASKIGGRKGKNICIKIHVQVAKAFVGRESDDLEVNHVFCDKAKNGYTQLEWTTRQGNMDHAKENGLLKQRRGADSHNAVLTQEEANRVLSLKGKHSQREIARMFGISRGVVENIHSGKRYTTA